MYARFQPWAQQSQQRAAQRPAVTGSARIPELVMAMVTAEDPFVPCREVGAIMLQRMLASPETKTRADLCDASAATLRVRASVPRHALGGIGPWDWREQLRAIRAPTLVVHGLEDASPVESAREWAELMPGGKLLIVEGAAHLPHAEKPEIVFAAIREHFR
jgi:pimeloyl-ACP methyl ester carboxylesterase